MMEDALAGRMPWKAAGHMVDVLLEIAKSPNRPAGLTNSLLSEIIGLVPSVVEGKVRLLFAGARTDLCVAAPAFVRFYHVDLFYLNSFSFAISFSYIQRKEKEGLQLDAARSAVNSQEEMVLTVLGAEAVGEGVVERACRIAARAAVAAEAGALRARIEATAAALSGRGGAAQGGGAALHAARAAGGGASGAGTGIEPLGGELDAAWAAAAAAGSLPLLAAAARGLAAAPNGGGLPLSNPDASASPSRLAVNWSPRAHATRSSACGRRAPARSLRRWSQVTLVK